MTVRDRRERERAKRHQLIVDTARELAEEEGWGAVTTRRLADRIGYSQSVLYSHFVNMEAIVQAVAVQGFAELATILRQARGRGDAPAEVLREIAYTYVEFGFGRPALYEAMFVRATDLVFGRPETPEPLQRAFTELREVVEALVGGSDPDTDTEVYWSALHGLVTLTRGRRLPVGEQGRHLEALLG
jgi:AcrR family transcriptional regulator